MTVAEQQGWRAGTPVPAVTVVVPTHGRPLQLRRCLDSLFAQSARREEYEIIVAVDGTTAETEDVLRGVEGQVVVVRQESSGAAAARNLGAQRATGRLLLFVDDDIVADSDLVAAHLSVQNELGPVVGLGHLVLEAGDHASGFSRYYAETRRVHFAHLAAGERQPTWRDCYGGNLSVPREAFLAAGGFAEDLPKSHDLEFGYRLSSRGLAFVYVADAVGRERSRARFSDVASRYEAEGAAAVVLAARHPSMIDGLDLPKAAPHPLRAHSPRRVLGLFRVPNRALALIGPVLPGARPRKAWYRFVAKYLYRRGVRYGATSPKTRRRLNQSAG